MEIFKETKNSKNNYKEEGKCVNIMLSELSRGNIDKSATVQQAHTKNWLSKIVSFQNNLGANEYRKDRRINGLQLPLHPLQIVGWITLIVFIFTFYFLIIPTFRETIIRLPLYVATSILLVIHVIAHIAALIIDPADIEIRKISSRKVVPEFDRTKHSHVIENGRCHLCNIKTSSQRTKHCSVCNKCVQEFDHHCKYLNSCVSKSRNYVPFLMCVASAVAAVLVILTAAITQFVLFYLNPSWLNLYWDKSSAAFPSSSVENDEELSIIDDFSTQINQFLNATLKLNETLSGGVENSTLNNITSSESVLNEGIGLYNTIYLIVIGVIAILAAITAGLLLHLFFFHLYICYLGLTTYEYIRNHRQTITNGGPSTTLNERKNKEIFVCSTINTSTDTRHRPKTLHCCDFSNATTHDPESLNRNIPISTSIANSASISQKAFYLCTLVEETTSDIDASIEYQENTTKTLHCCSEFAHITKSQNGIQKIVQYTEQCAFCSFHIKPSRKLEHQKRCCIKTNIISKHHRWRRKWNCCSNVPNSPEDIPGINNLQMISSHNNHPSISSGAAAALQPNYVQIEIPIDNCANNNSSISENNITTNHHQNDLHSHHKNNNGTNKYQSMSDDMKSISTISAACSNDIISESSCKINNANIPKKPRSKLVRPWPVRLRYVFRMINLNRYRRPRCRGSIGTLKQNQVRPLAGSTSNENIEGINDIAVIPPSAPAPNRRKLKNSTDLQDLADSLSIIQPSSTTPTVPTLQNIRRQRRKNILNRNKSPTLSPIHESGFSNPASPQLACKHACSGSISSLGNNVSLCGNRNLDK